MKTLKMSCELLTDIVLNASSATEGDHTTLDFIPGNNFLGIVAKHYDEFSPKEQMTIFHSGKVRFGDAHPLAFDKRGEVIAVRTLHMPAALFYPKMQDVSDRCYLGHLYDRKVDKEKNGQPMQLKQCRRGYYAFTDQEGRPAKVEKGFTLKSAYDRCNRTSKEGQMFGYESLKAGQKFFFEVEVDDDALASKIEELLTGEQYIGRSRSAEYGQVRIAACSFDDVPSSATPVHTKEGDLVAVYADSRLIFLNREGQPVYQPTAEQLGLDGEIVWEMSQVRTFQYAPWNFKRGTRDADRCGIEKGSVIFVKTSCTPSGSAYVGSFRNEGFGRIVYNPDFLRERGKTGDNGEALWKILPLETSQERRPADPLRLQGTPLLDFIRRRREQDEAESVILREVNDFVDKNKSLFSGAAFASQWGTIRSIAMAHPDVKELLDELFDKKIDTKHAPSPSDPRAEDRPEPAAYLAHGVAEEKWKKRDRREKLRGFIEGLKVADAYKQGAVINLASEMAKICKSNGKD